MSAAEQAIRPRRDSTAPIPSLLVAPPPSWQVALAGHPVVEVFAANWLGALSLALHRFGLDQGIERMACEVLANGEVIVNDITHQRRYVVRQLSGVASA